MKGSCHRPLTFNSYSGGLISSQRSVIGTKSCTGGAGGWGGRAVARRLAARVRDPVMISFLIWDESRAADRRALMRVRDPMAFSFLTRIESRAARLCARASYIAASSKPRLLSTIIPIKRQYLKTFIVQLIVDVQTLRAASCRKRPTVTKSFDCEFTCLAPTRIDLRKCRSEAFLQTCLPQGNSGWRGNLI